MSRLKHETLKFISEKLTAVKDWPLRPARGWVNAVRTSLGMPSEVLAKRVGVSRQRINAIEEEEVNDALTIQTLRRVAEALECELVYVLVPKEGSLEDVLRKRVEQKARDIMTSVDRTMRLEGQGVRTLEENVQELVDEMMNEFKSSIWKD